MPLDDVVLFALNASRPFGERIARRLNTDLADHEERDFEDGEHKARPLVNVRGRHAFVIQSLYGDEQQTVNDKLCRMLFFIGAVKDASAASVTAVVPYLCYARKDRKTKTRDPLTTRYIAQLFEAIGTDRIVTMDVHNLAAFQNAARCDTDHLQAMKLFVSWFREHLGEEEVAVISPDIGGAKRANQLAEALGRALGRETVTAFVEKHRSGGVVTGGAFAGEVEGRTAIIVDDLIASGGTILRAARACHELGAKRIFAAATHGLFVGKANEVFADDLIERLLIADTVPPFRLQPEIVERRVEVLSAADLFAEAIDAIRTGGPVEEISEI